LITAVAYAQTLSSRNYDLKSNGQLKKNGADKLVVLVETKEDQPSTKSVFLEGLKGGKLLWKKVFPIRSDVNLPKSGAQANGTYIDVWSQMPMKATTVTQRFLWDGSKLTFKGNNVEDASQQAVNRYEQIAKNGTRAQFEKAQRGGDLEVMYPISYVTDFNTASIIEGGHKTALSLYRSGNAKAAAERMELALDCASDFASLAYPEEGNERTKLELWLRTFGSKGVDLERWQYMSAINDYAFFLAENKEFSQAIPILRRVVALNSNRVVAYLNLADSLWEAGNKNEARRYYSDYVERMGPGNKSVPARASQRSQGVKQDESELSSR
jgi:tetratricopeptide (TPR) repeat protein